MFNQKSNLWGGYVLETVDCWNGLQTIQGIIHHSEFFKGIKLYKQPGVQRNIFIVSPQFLQNFSKPEYPFSKSLNSSFVIFIIIDYSGFNMMKSFVHVFLQWQFFVHLFLWWQKACVKSLGLTLYTEQK